MRSFSGLFAAAAAFLLIFAPVLAPPLLLFFAAARDDGRDGRDDWRRARVVVIPQASVAR